MKRKSVLIFTLIIPLPSAGCGRQENDGIIRVEWSHTYEGYFVVCVARSISADGRISAYNSLEAF